MNSQSNSQSEPQKILEVQWLAAEDALRDAIGRFGTQPRFENEFISAFLQFWGVDDPEELFIELDEETPEFALTFEWYLYDYRESQTGRRMIDLFADVEGSRLPALQQQLLSRWREACLAPYEVLTVQPGVEYTVVNVLSGETLVVEDASSSEELKPGDLIVARLLPVGSKVRPSSVFRTFAASDLPRLKAMLIEAYAEYEKEHPSTSWSAFLQERGYLFNDYALERRFLAGRMADASESAEQENMAQWLYYEEYEPAEMTERLLRLKNQYLEWLERPTPALDGLTPRQAVQTPQGRPKVLVLLQEMGEIEASYALVGDPTFEIADLLPALGLQISDFLSLNE